MWIHLCCFFFFSFLQLNRTIECIIEFSLVHSFADLLWAGLLLFIFLHFGCFFPSFASGFALSHCLILFALYSDASISFIVHIYLLQRRKSSKCHIFHLFFFFSFFCWIGLRNSISSCIINATVLYASIFGIRTLPESTLNRRLARSRWRWRANRGKIAWIHGKIGEP